MSRLSWLCRLGCHDGVGRRARGQSRDLRRCAPLPVINRVTKTPAPALRFWPLVHRHTPPRPVGPAGSSVDGLNTCSNLFGGNTALRTSGLAQVSRDRRIHKTSVRTRHRGPISSDGPFAPLSSTRQIPNSCRRRRATVSAMPAVHAGSLTPRFSRLNCFNLAFVTPHETYRAFLFIFVSSFFPQKRRETPLYLLL